MELIFREKRIIDKLKTGLTVNNRVIEVKVYYEKVEDCEIGVIFLEGIDGSHVKTYTELSKPLLIREGISQFDDVLFS